MTMVRVGTTVLVESILSNVLSLYPYQQWPEPRPFWCRHPKTYSLVNAKILHLQPKTPFTTNSETCLGTLQLVQVLKLLCLHVTHGLTRAVQKSQMLNDGDKETKKHAHTHIVACLKNIFIFLFSWKDICRNDVYKYIYMNDR